MANRRNFPRAVRVEIVKRATRNGQTYCEAPGCGCLAKTFEIHHLTMDALEVDKSRKLTAKDGALYCIPCHDAETIRQAPILAKALAREAAHLNARPATSRPISSAGFAKSAKAIARAKREPRQRIEPKVLFR